MTNNYFKNIYGSGGDMSQLIHTCPGSENLRENDLIMDGMPRYARFVAYVISQYKGHEDFDNACKFTNYAQLVWFLERKFPERSCDSNQKLSGYHNNPIEGSVYDAAMQYLKSGCVGDMWRYEGVIDPTSSDKSKLQTIVGTNYDDWASESFNNEKDRYDWEALYFSSSYSLDRFKKVYFPGDESFMEMPMSADKIKKARQIQKELDEMNKYRHTVAEAQRIIVEFNKRVISCKNEKELDIEISTDEISRDVLAIYIEDKLKKYNSGYSALVCSTLLPVVALPSGKYCVKFRSID